MNTSEKPHSAARIPGHVERVGLFGGSFDPVHFGHLLLAQTALEELSLDRIIFIPAGISPFKQEHPPVASARDRLEMLRLAIAEEPRFSVDDRELQRKGPSYTIDTVRSLLGDYPGVRFLYLIGADQLKDLHGWHESEELKNLIDFAVFDRADLDPANAAGYPILRRRVDLSSTEIRERLAMGLAVSYYLPETVRQYLMTHSLYLSPPSDGHCEV